MEETVDRVPSRPSLSHKKLQRLDARMADRGVGACWHVATLSMPDVISRFGFGSSSRTERERRTVSPRELFKNAATVRSGTRQPSPSVPSQSLSRRPLTPQVSL